jgi:hypothetical protein
MSDKEKELKRAVAELSKTAGLPESGGKSKYAEMIVQLVQPNHLTLDLIRAFLNVETFNRGDQFTKRVRRGRYPVRTMVPGAKHLTDVTDFAEKVTYSFDTLIAGTNRNIIEIRNGEVGTVDSMRRDLRNDLFDKLISNVFNLTSTVWNSSDTPSNFIDASGTGLTKAATDTMIETILETSGDVRAIIGTRKALGNLYEFAQYQEFVLNGTGVDRGWGITDAFYEFTRTNRVTTYKGIPVVELPQTYTNTLRQGTNSGIRNPQEKLISDDRVMLIGQNAGTFALIDGVEYQEHIDTSFQPANYQIHCWQSYGIILDAIEQIGIIKVA